MTYEKHIGSARWRHGDARLGELEAAGHRCRTCFERGTVSAPLEVHHRTYARFGCELIGDLTTLCRDCHRVITDSLRHRRYASIRPRIVDTLPLFERSAPLFDPF
jgi:5-methylcytosine-specific restriction endonuclease McrA